ncbi:porin family protein [Paraflavitalea pollutisoli]|uniref:porin family protein n=1 Tax=Paraflavitalea pollutisoli TaxID=3034143 RepID=UPI0023EA9C20|nr:porin family protein [Paraflavitalea sp. H1-2-19X]
MKKFFLVLLLAGGNLLSFGQVKYGAKAGLNLSNVAGDVEGNKMKLGIHFGGFADVAFAEQFSFHPELVFSTQGAKSDWEYEGVSGKSTINLTYINLPLLAQYNHESGFFAHTGPQLGFLLSAKAKSDGEKEDLKDGYKTFDFAWAFGAGYVTKSNIGFNARFNLGLSNLGKESGDYKVKNSVIQIGAFYILGSK